MAEKTFVWDELAVKEIIRQTVQHIFSNEQSTINSIYDSIKKDYDDWYLVDSAIEKYQDYINEQTNAVKTISSKWGEYSDEDGTDTEIDGIKMRISVTKAK